MIEPTDPQKLRVTELEKEKARIESEMSVVQPTSRLSALNNQLRAIIDEIKKLEKLE
ncbi:MAG: hypothetical protein WAV18_13015 [Roseiarcus sp.]